MMSSSLAFTILIAALFNVSSSYAQAPSDFSKQVDQFVIQMSQDYNYSASELRHLFAQVNYLQEVIDAITRPAEAKPWYEYRAIFVTSQRIAEGVKFWSEREQTLKTATEQYGVPPEIIVSILGVETFFGNYKGKYRVLDSLATLAFGYHKRGDFFRQELQQFLLLTQEEGIDPLSIRGSYAGAMGMPQFISSSYRTYAIDFDGDGVRDLWQSVDDAIGSVANYFSKHGWQRDGLITGRCEVDGLEYTLLLDSGLKPSHSFKRVKQMGVAVDLPVDGDPDVGVLMLDAKGSDECWLTLNNFYVITRYNHSPLYAMAVYQLGAAIKADYEKIANAKSDP
jgi:membrane-bound lytic murein transglycosylase B